MNKRYVFLAAGLALLIIILLASAISSVAPTKGNGVAIIPVTGIITTESVSGFLSTQSASSTQITRWLEDANEDRNIHAILLEINSPGGSAVASDEIVQALKHVDKPVVAWIRESGASGAYWIASEADHVIANRMSITGSVGVIASYLNFADFITDYNITYQRLVSGEDKDLASPVKHLSERQEELLQAKLDTIHEFFVSDVQANRNLTDEQASQISSGIFYLGSEAYELGLVDELGTRYEVQNYLEELLGAEPRYTRYQQRRGALAEIFSVTIPTSGWRIQT